MNDVQITNEDFGEIEHITDYVKATLTRRLDHPTTNVWAMLTDSAHIKDWLAPGEIELTKGGRAKLNFGDGGIIIAAKCLNVRPTSCWNIFRAAPKISHIATFVGRSNQNRPALN